MRFPVLFFLLCLAAAPAANGPRATLLREGALYATPDDRGDPAATVPRGSDLTLLGSNGATDPSWQRVSVAGGDPAQPGREGWIKSKALLAVSLPNADQIAYGEAVDSEHEAEKRSGRPSAAADAARLYRWTADAFPQSPLAGEAAWRSADIEWQLARAHGHRPGNDSGMKQVIEKYPGTKWADLAAYELIDSELCADVTAQASCAQKNAAIYERYARQHPQSVKAAESLFHAAYQNGLLADIYRVRANKESSSAARQKALELAKELSSGTTNEWKTRAVNLLYKLEQNVPLYGPEQEQEEQ